MEPETRRTILALCWFLAGVLASLSLFDAAGRVGDWLKPALFSWFGWGAYILPFLVAALAVSRLDPGRFTFSRSRYVGLLLALLTGLGIFHLPASQEEGLVFVDEGRGGGYVGWAVAYWLRAAVGGTATVVALAVLFAMGVMLVSNKTPSQFLSWVRLRRLERARERLAAEGERAPAAEVSDGSDGNGRTEDAEAMDGASSAEADATDVSPSVPLFSTRVLDGVRTQGGAGKPAPSRVKTWLPPYQPPPLELLSDASTRPVSTDVKIAQQTIQRTLETFDIAVEMDAVSVGPTVTQYTLRPSKGVKLSQIVALHNDLSLALAAHPIRIEAPIPGKPLVGIEVPNKAVSIVRLREILSSEAFTAARGALPFALGKDVAGQPLVADLERMPHFLIAGATGSGKSVLINSLLVSLLYRNSPLTLRLILVDPKRVELTLYNTVPHLLSPVVTEAEKTIKALRWAVAEMDRRYELLSDARCRDLSSYNQGRRPEAMLPRIVIVVDELADIMARYAREMENTVVRLAKIARAVGIHLVLATQRPSVDVITGLIKANITSRVAFKVASSVDARTILDSSGAEKLLGSGDMLYLASDHTKPRRLQGAYVAAEEVKRVVNHLARQGSVVYDDAVLQLQEHVSGTSLLEEEEATVDEEMRERAEQVVREVNRASTSLLQRRLRIGYSRAARILDVLEKRGVVGPPDGARPREVFAKRGDKGEGRPVVNEEGARDLLPRDKGPDAAAPSGGSESARLTSRPDS